MKTPLPPSTASRLAAAVLEAHPAATLVVNGAFEIVHANGAARRLLGAREGVTLRDALGCIEQPPQPRSAGQRKSGDEPPPQPRSAGQRKSGDEPGSDGCAVGSRCGGCAFYRAVERALAGEASRERGFVLRSERGKPADLHLLAAAVPFEQAGAPHAVLALDDANAILGDPGVVRVCEGCGRVQDEEGEWHPLHRYLEDRLGLETAGPLCDACASGAPAPRRPPT